MALIPIVIAVGTFNEDFWSVFSSVRTQHAWTSAVDWSSGQPVTGRCGAGGVRDGLSDGLDGTAKAIAMEL